MKPAVFISLVLFCLVYVGNACMKSGFVADSVTATGENFSACAADEASLNRAFLQDTKIGYMGEDKVSYSKYNDESVIIHGDMIVPADGGVLPSKPAPRGIGQGVGVKMAERWPNGKIPFKIPLNFPNRSRVDAAIEHWNTKLAGVIQLVPWSNESAYMNFVTMASGCMAWVGYSGTAVTGAGGVGSHDISLSTACSEGNIIHEIGHIVGLQHEQNRIDRDLFVSINWEKIKDGFAGNFEVDSSRYQNYRSYDFGSIMHYSLAQFSKDMTNVIVPKVSIPSDIVVGQRVMLTKGDINSVREMYGFAPLEGEEPGPEIGGGTLSGIAGSYYQRTDFQDLRASQLDKEINFDWETDPPHSKISGTRFSARWRGWLIPEQTGTYQFELVSSGAFKVMMDSSVIFESKKNAQKNTFVSTFYELNAGQKIRLVVDYATTGTENAMKLRWIRPDGVEEVVPTSQLLADDAAVNELENICTNSN